jgi:hypothetical protein
MKAQNYSNHVRIHPLFHYLILPASLLLIPVSVINLVMNFSFGSAILVIAALLLQLLAFLTRLYAKKNQDRIILTEMRLRYYLLTGDSFSTVEKRLSFGQIAALRFASDEELVSMAKDAASLGLSSESIKKNIQYWNPDNMRV